MTGGDDRGCRDAAWVRKNFDSRRGAETQRSFAVVAPVPQFFMARSVILNLLQDNMRRLFVILKQVQDDEGEFV